MNQYTKHQVIASICVALFIVNFAFIMMAHNRSTFRKCSEGMSVTDDQRIEHSGLEAQICFEELADSYCNFFKGDYEVVGHKVSEDNIDLLKRYQWYYRMAWIIVVLSVIYAIRSFVVLSTRRLYMPLLYGGAGAIALTLLHVLRIATSGKELYTYVRDMVFHKDYSCFVKDGVFGWMIPENYGPWIFATYILYVVGLCAFMALVRAIIIFKGRPHKY